MKKITMLLAAALVAVGAQAQRLEVKNISQRMQSAPAVKRAKSFAKQNAAVAQLAQFEKAKALAPAKEEAEFTGFANKTLTDFYLLDFDLGELMFNLIPSSYEIDGEDVRCTIFEALQSGFTLEGKIVGKSKVDEAIDSIEFSLDEEWTNPTTEKTFKYCGIDVEGWDTEYTAYTTTANEKTFVGGWYDGEYLYILEPLGIVEKGTTTPIWAEEGHIFNPKSIASVGFPNITTYTDDGTDYTVEGKGIVMPGSQYYYIYIQNTDPIYGVVEKNYPDLLPNFDNQWYQLYADVENNQYYLPGGQNVGLSGYSMVIVDGEYVYNGAYLTDGESADGALTLSLPEDKYICDQAYFEEDGDDPAGYYYITQASKYVLNLFLDETAIKGVKTVEGKTNGALYNIAGQKVGNSYKGIVIKDGKKFLQK